MRKKKITPGWLALNLISIVMAVIYLAPVVGFILAIIRHLQSIAYDVSEMKKALAEEAAK